jgi:hypothetical protein
VLVGGTASALHAEHRVSFDHDHVLTDLRDRFDAVLSELEATKGWNTVRVKRPVLILGNLDGVDTGIRQLIRCHPVEIEHFATPVGNLTVPTLAECLRIKAWLVLTRNATRDYLDVAALTDRLGAGSMDALISMDTYYADQHGRGGDRVISQLVKQLAEPTPYDLSDVDLAQYRKLARRWREWAGVLTHLSGVAVAVMERLAAEEPRDEASTP